MKIIYNFHLILNLKKRQGAGVAIETGHYY